MSRLVTPPKQVIGSFFTEDNVQFFSGDPFSTNRGSEVITCIGEVEDQTVAAVIHNPLVEKGYISSLASKKILNLMNHCEQMGIPLVTFFSSPGITLNEGASSGDAYSAVLKKTVHFRGKIPQYGVVLGPTFGAAAYSASLQDLLIFNQTRSYLMVSPPNIVEGATGQKVSLADLGSPQVHAQKTGLAHFVEKDIESQIRRLRTLLRYFPSNCLEEPAIFESKPSFGKLPVIPENPAAFFDIKDLLNFVCDKSQYIEYASEYGKSMVCAWSYIGGFPVGIVASQSIENAGALTVTSTEKVSRFVRMCDCYSIPILTFVDTPGFLPGVEQEQAGLLKMGADFCVSMQTRVPRIGVLVRKCFGAAALLLAQGKNWGGDFTFALENATGSIMSDRLVSDVLATSSVSSHLLQGLDLQSHALVDEVITLQQLRRKLEQTLRLCKLRKDKTYL